MPVKDYYQLLEISADSSEDTIKKAYRKQAMRYHPDKNMGNPFAIQHFREIQEAYEVLSNPVKRSEYHQQRWQQAGHPLSKPSPVLPSPALLLREAQKLYESVKQMDVFRMNTDGLAIQLKQLLSPLHLHLLQNSGNNELNTEFVHTLLNCMKALPYPYWKTLLTPLVQLAGSDELLLQQIQQQEHNKKSDDWWEKYKPWLILALAIAISALIYIIA